MTSHWFEVEERIIKFAAHDSKKVVTSLIAEYNEVDEKNAGQ